MDKQFDYQELIDELKEEVSFGILTNESMIQVLRAIDSYSDGYSEILDWYYNEETMELELEPETEDSIEDAADKEIIKKQYLQDKAKLEDMTVESCLAEMFERTVTKTKKSRNKKSNPFF